MTHRPDSHSLPHELVSVVIPCYKQGHFVHEAIQSVLGQKHGDYEIIVVDDASPDDTSQVVHQFPSVRYVRHPVNRGLGASRNTGISHSQGPFLVFLDADDRILSHHFETCLQAFRERPQLALVCGDFRWFGAEGTWHRHECSNSPDQYEGLLRSGYITPPHSTMVKRQALVEVGGFSEDPGFQGSEDRDCWLRVTRRYPIYCHHTVIAEYRRHSEQMSRKWDLMLCSGIAVMRRQWPYVRGNPRYEDAYRSGVRQYQEACGPPLAWQMVHHAKAGRWRQALKAFWVLVRLYPQGLKWLLRHKVERVLKDDTSASSSS
jgi:glycosyltransferase involved in cell wall biosynthesis